MSEHQHFALDPGMTSEDWEAAKKLAQILNEKPAQEQHPDLEDALDFAQDKALDQEPNQPPKRRGLYRKFKVERTDKNLAKHPCCVYFVLDLTHDAAARYAALEYARQVDNDNEDRALAADLRRLVRKYRGF